MCDNQIKTKFKITEHGQIDCHNEQLEIWKKLFYKNIFWLEVVEFLE